VSNREFEDAVKQHAAAAGMAPVEAEGELVEVAGKVWLLH
jgi:hypothetical protein